MQTEILRLKEKFTEYSGYLTNEAMLHYLCDMVIAQGYAAFNRKLIIQRIIRALAGTLQYPLRQSITISALMI